MSLRRLQQAATRQRLIDAARQLFFDLGYATVTIDKITKAAGTGRATFYLHFPKKSDVLLALWKDEQQRVAIPLYREFDHMDAPSRGNVTDWLDTLLTFWEDNRSNALVANQALALEPDLASEWIRGMGMALEVMPHTIKRLDADPARARTKLLLRIIQWERVAFFWLTGQFPATRDELIEILADIWLES